MIDIKDTKSTIRTIRNYIDEVEDTLDELWDEYLDVCQERDKLLERVEELEEMNA